MSFQRFSQRVTEHTYSELVGGTRNSFLGVPVKDLEIGVLSVCANPLPLPDDEW